MLKNKKTLVVLCCILFSGCAQEFKPVVTKSGGGSTESSEESRADSGNKLAQCSRELAALQKFDAEKYTKYQREFDHITRTGAQYLTVAKGISGDINDLVRPKYQYALTNLCYHIRTDLSNSLINQVKSDE